MLLCALRHCPLLEKWQRESGLPSTHHHNHPVCSTHPSANRVDRSREARGSSCCRWMDGFLLERRVGGQEINNTEALTEDLSSQHHNSKVVVIYSPGLTMLPKGSWHHIIRILSLSLSFSHTQKPFPVHHHLVYAQKDYL